MIIDASVLVAIALRGGDRGALEAKIDAAATVGAGAPTLVEAGMVVAARTGADGAMIVTELLARAGATVIEFGDPHWREALNAWARFGKGRHAARLNFGDCLAYATARVAGEPLLALGSDFAKTDLELA